MCFLSSFEMHFVMHADTLVTMLVCTLSGGLGRQGNVSSRAINSSSILADSCASPTHGKQPSTCQDLDALILPVHLLIPWITTLCTLVFLSMPTLLLLSKGKEVGLQRFAATLLRFLALLGSVSLASTTPLAVRFVFSVYACVRVLVSAKGGVGAEWWWGLRYTALAGLFAWQVFHGPPISLMSWPGSGLGQGSLHCAYLAHLVGCVGPGIVLAAVQCVISLARFVDIRGDA
jgi:hypothetical protein